MDVTLNGTVRVARTRHDSPATADTVRFAIGRCVYGTLLVARSPRGLCAILFGDDPDALGADLTRRYPDAEDGTPDPAMADTLARVATFVETPGAELGLPLDLRGTDFMLEVWQALRDIPAGATESYAQVARRIGAPVSARAVARACAANMLAVVVPCHRVVAADGRLSGYRWGVERKRALLAREAGQ